jgi:uncharacterized protein YndB with AHSA1/START domain
MTDKPLVKTITVPWPVERAFERFTKEIGTWWPLDTHSVFPDENSTVTMPERPGDEIVETNPGGETGVWGTMLAFEAPGLVRFTWHPGRGPETAQEVEVKFTADGDGTRVELTHTGWDVLGEKAEETRSGYDSGWDFVLGRYTG